MADILIYSTAVCPYCVAAKNFLKARGLDYREQRIDMDSVVANSVLIPTYFVADS